MEDSDKPRASRDEPLKWQYAKLGLLLPLWKMKAYSHRLIYDKGWHGGNRKKAAAPDTTTEEEWIACGLYGQPDSQHHWIRECTHPAR